MISLRNVIILFLCICASTALYAQDKPFEPVPTTVSSMAQNILKSKTPSSENIESIKQWQGVRKAFNEQQKNGSDAVKKEYTNFSEIQSIAGVRVLVVTPKSYTRKNRKKIAIYIHGGAYTLGKPDYLYGAFAPLSNAISLKVFAIDYRLAPEHPFPAGLDDTLAVYKALLKRYKAKNIVMFGDSAGGGLSLATLLKAQSENLKMPAALVLYSPWSDITKTGDSYYTLENISPLLHYEKNLRSSAQVYAGKTNSKNPLISPVYATYSSSFPPTLIQVGTRDLF
jgi:acetyl esterase/lipase